MNDQRSELLRKNKRRIFWTRLFIDTKPLNSVLTFFYLAKGLNLSSVYYLGIFWAVTSFALEIPTGYLADIIGRKKTLILGVLLYIFGVITFLLSHGFWGFALAITLQSAAFSCFSGVDSALIYDSLKEIGDEKSTVRVSGKYFSAGQFAKIFTPLIAAFVAKDLLLWQFQTLLFADLFFSCISLFFAFKLTEPNRISDLSQKEVGILRDSFELFKKDASARKMAFNKVLFFIASLLFWKIYQPFLKGVGISVPLLGVLYSIMQIILFSSLWFSERIKKSLGATNYLNIPVILSLVGVVCLLFVKDKWILFALSVLPLAFGSARDPIFVYQLNLRIKSFNRATANSVFNFMRGFFDVPLSLLTGYLVVFGVNWVFYVVIAICLLCLTVFSVTKKDLLFEKSD